MLLQSPRFSDKNLQKFVVSAFFGCYLLIGFIVYPDYGIQWDEMNSMNRGQMTYDYVVKNDERMVLYFDYHGYAFDMLVFFLEDALHMTDSRDKFMFKHLLNFLLFLISVFFFYLLARDHFQSWKMGLVASLFLFLSPRIFADAFYNPKDIPAMSFFIIAIYTLVKYLDQKTSRRASYHALACALAIDSRIVAVLIPVMTFGLLVFEWISAKLRLKNIDTFGTAKSFILYSILVVIFSILFWPTLWNDPFKNIFDAVHEASQYPWGGRMNYMGKLITGINLPWHYIPVWMSITTPPFYTFLFLVGLIYVARAAVDFFRGTPIARHAYIILAWFFVPLISMILFNTVLYNAWRHLFFIYPGFLMIALMGLHWLWTLFKKLRPVWAYVLKVGLIFLMIVSLACTVNFMVKAHPFQNVYFNFLVGGLAGADNKFDLDYWGLSYRKALEYILENDTAPKIKIHVANSPGKKNADILEPFQRDRLVYVGSNEEAKYYLTNRYRQRNEPISNEEFYAIKVDGVKIMVVYKME